MRRTGLYFCAAMMLVGPAASGELVSSANTAEGLAAQNKYLDAIDEMSWAVAKLWQWSPLLVRRALFVAGQPGGFAVYDERKDAVFKRDETMVIYAEPVGYGYSFDQGQYSIDLVLDYEVKDKTGKVVAAQVNFGTSSFKSRVQSREFASIITYSFTTLNPGDYEVTTTMTDKATEKTANFTLAFTLIN